MRISLVANKMSIQLLKTLREQVLLLIGRLEEILGGEHHDLLKNIIGPFFDNMNAEYLMHHIIKQVLPWELQIRGRNEMFFYNNKKIFGDLPSGKVDFFSDLAKNGSVSSDDKEEVFQFFEVFVVCAEEYRKIKN